MRHRLRLSGLSTVKPAQGLGKGDKYPISTPVLDMAIFYACISHGSVCVCLSVCVSVTRRNGCTDRVASCMPISLDIYVTVRITEIRASPKKGCFQLEPCHKFWTPKMLPRDVHCHTKRDVNKRQWSVCHWQHLMTTAYLAIIVVYWSHLTSSSAYSEMVVTGREAASRGFVGVSRYL